LPPAAEAKKPVAELLILAEGRREIYTAGFQQRGNETPVLKFEYQQERF